MHTPFALGENDERFFAVVEVVAADRLRDDGEYMHVEDSVKSFEMGGVD
jgi:hypothetical protein